MPDTVMVPRNAIVLYGNNSKQSTVEFWDIQEGMLVNPRPVTRQSVSDLLAFSRRSKERRRKAFSGIIPAGTLGVSECNMAFLIPPGEHVIYLDKHGEKKRKARAERVWLPAMVFDYTGPHHDIRVFWCKGGMEQLLRGDKCLTPAIMPNIDDHDGSLCNGTSMDKVKFNENMGVMQTLILRSFFKSSFNEWRSKNVGPIMNYCMSPEGQPGREHEAFWSGKTSCEELNQIAIKGPWKKLQFPS